MVKSKLGKKVLEISEGLLASLTDLVLCFFLFGYESITDPRVGRSLPYTLAKMDKRMEMINYRSLKRAIDYALDKGWIKQNLRVSAEGQKRLREIFSPSTSGSNWDGNWYLVNFDIPETFRRRRNILRENLERLGFGKLQNSIWISPYNFLGDVKKIVQDLDIVSGVIFSISNKVGEEQSKELAEKIWKLSEIQEKYQEFVVDFEAGKTSLIELFFTYQSILSQDPCLPQELLPNDCAGEEAKREYLKISQPLNFK